MKSSNMGQVIGIPIRSITTYPILYQRSPMALLANSTTTLHDHQFHDDRASSALKRSSNNKIHSVLNKMNKLGKKAHDSLSHVKLGPKITRVLQFGGFEKIYKQLFGDSVGQDEKLMNAFECHLWTTVGPIAGLLFVSTAKISFCSRKSIKLSSPNGKLIRARYKVVVPINKLKRVEQSDNVDKTTQKFIELVTVDNFDFWFTGFFNHHKAFNCLQQSLVSLS